MCNILYNVAISYKHLSPICFLPSVLLLYYQEILLCLLVAMGKRVQSCGLTLRGALDPQACEKAACQSQQQLRAGPENVHS